MFKVILSDKDIRLLCTNSQTPLISPFNEERLQGASYDISMSDTVHVFKDAVQTIYLTDQASIDSIYCQVKIKEYEPFVLKPNEYVLVTLKEHLSIPHNMIAHIRPRTKFTRLGIIITDQHCNPGYQGVLQVGIRNVSPNSIALSPDLSIAQIVFEELKSEPSPNKLYDVKEHASYQGEKEFIGARFTEKDFSPEARELYEKIMSGACVK